MILSRMYDTLALTEAKPRLETRVREILAKGLRPKFSPDELRKLNQVQLDFPLVGQRRDPFDYYANYANQTVYFPIISLRFFEDICTAYAWLWANNFSLSTIDEYVAMLKYRPFSEFASRGYSLPLDALRIPDNALADQNVDQLSLRIRNSGYAFILAHELGHIYYEDRGYAGLTSDQAQRIETKADHFALDILQRASTIPMGAMLWLQATAYFSQNRGDFQSDEEWKEFLHSEMTHPLNSFRLHTLAARLYAQADDFSHYEKDRQSGKENLEFIAQGMLRIAEIADDMDLQRTIAGNARSANLSTLAPRREHQLW